MSIWEYCGHRRRTKGETTKRASAYRRNLVENRRKSPLTIEVNIVRSFRPVLEKTGVDTSFRASYNLETFHLRDGLKETGSEGLDRTPLVPSWPERRWNTDEGRSAPRTLRGCERDKPKCLWGRRPDPEEVWRCDRVGSKQPEQALSDRVTFLRLAGGEESIGERNELLVHGSEGV